MTAVRFISTTETARLLHLSEDTVRRRIHAGRIVAVQCGRIWRVRADLLLAGAA